MYLHWSGPRHVVEDVKDYAFQVEDQWNGKLENHPWNAVEVLPRCISQYDCNTFTCTLLGNAYARIMPTQTFQTERQAVRGGKMERAIF